MKVCSGQSNTNEVFMESRKITLGTLNINATGKKYVNDALDSNRLSAGKYTKKFEDDFSQLHGCQYGIFMNSGTSALQVALAAMKEVHGYKPGDEVIVPATTFIATSNVVIQAGLKPVFAEVDPKTFNIDPVDLHYRITSRTRCVIPVHLFGLSANMPEICSMSHKYDFQIIEDSCESMFAGIKGQPVGSFGDIGCFSTYVAHLVVGGVGGLITTNDKKLEEISRSFMAHGRNPIYTNIDMDDTEDDVIRKEMIERRYEFERVGYSYRATELEAALALSEFQVWRKNIQTRRDNAALLTSLLSDIPFLQLPYIPKGYTHSFMMYPMVLDGWVDREKFLMHLEKSGIETRYMFPLLGQPVYQKLFPGLEHQYPVSKRLAKQGFFIGMHQGLTVEDIEYISEVMHAFQF
jgi:dTDP-4-amino-4,6-dideoxygalactose transaminase